MSLALLVSLLSLVLRLLLRLVLRRSATRPSTKKADTGTTCREHHGLLEPEIVKLLEGYDRLDVFLSHYHLDHCVGLAYLPEVWRGREVVIHGPAPPFAEATPDEALGRLLHAPFSAPLAVFPLKAEIVPVSETAMTVSGLDMSFRGQTHMYGSMGIRIGDDIAYVTDTVADEGTIDLARNVKLLMHEVYLTDSELKTDAINAAKMASMSARAALLLLCDHASNALPPEYGDLGLGPEQFRRHIAQRLHRG